MADITLPLQEFWRTEKITLEELQKYVQDVDPGLLMSTLKLNVPSTDGPLELSDVCRIWIKQYSPTKGDVVNVDFSGKSKSTSDFNQKPNITAGSDTKPEWEHNSGHQLETNSNASHSRSRSPQGNGQNRVHYGIGDITKPIGVLVRYRSEEGDTVPAEGVAYDYEKVGDLIKNQNIMVKVRPILLSFSGLPESKKSTVLREFLDNHVRHCPFKAITNINDEHRDVPITQYELIADGTNPDVNFTLSEAMKESYFTFGVLSAFKNILATQGKVPVIDVFAELNPYFAEDHDDLEKFFVHAYQYFCNKYAKQKVSTDDDNKATASLGLMHSLPDCLTLLNIWDHSISNVVRHLLSALQGHLYNHHMFLFLDLERDLENLDEPPKIAKPARDGAVFMKWRPRLHYLLRSAWATAERGKERRRTCTLFAKSDRSYTREVREDINKLEDNVNPVAKHIGVSTFLDQKIEVVNVSRSQTHTNLGSDQKSDQKRVYQRIQRIALDEPIDKIPFSWVFLRSSFLHSNDVFISKIQLQQKAAECGINGESLSKFCKFYTSFGSIIDLSLINPDYQYVLVKPIKFLRLLGEFMNPNNDTLRCHPIIGLGIVPEKVCIEVFNDRDFAAVMNALESLNLAKRVGHNSIELPPNYSLDQYDQAAPYYYIPLCCKGDPITEVEADSVHLITNIDTPHFFKQVTIVDHLLNALKELQPKLVACSNINQTIIKVSGLPDTTITFTFHSPVIKIRVHTPDKTVCAKIVQVFNTIATNAYNSSQIRVKYKFVRMCAIRDISDVQSLLSSRYHLLPYYGSCEHCTTAGRDDEILKAWNEALENCPVPDESKPTGEIRSHEIIQLAEKMAECCNNTEMIAEIFVPDYMSLPHLSGDDLLKEILFHYYKMLKEDKNSPEPRRAFALNIAKLKEKITCQNCIGNPQHVKAKLEKLAKEIDIYFRPRSSKKEDEQCSNDQKMKEDGNEEDSISGEIGQSFDSAHDTQNLLIDEPASASEKTAIENIFRAKIETQPIDSLSACDHEKKHVTGKMSFYIEGDAPKRINWEDYGVRIEVPKGSLLSSEVAQVSLEVHVVGLFKVPQNTELVSAVYSVSISKLLLKPLTFEIQHCINLTKKGQTKHLKFVTAPIDPPEGFPYQFLPNDDDRGLFKAKEKYGSIQINKSVYVGIVRYLPEQEIQDQLNNGNNDNENGQHESSDESDEDNSSKDSNSQSGEASSGDGNQSEVPPSSTTGKSTSAEEVSSNDVIYYSMFYYTKRKDNTDHCLMHFSVSRDLEALKRYLEREHADFDKDQGHQFQFESYPGYVKLNFDIEQTEDNRGWKLRPHKRPCKLTQSAINTFGSNKCEDPPSCIVSIDVQRDLNPVSVFYHGVRLEGIVEPIEIFIHRKLESMGPLSSTPKVSATSETISSDTAVANNAGSHDQSKSGSIIKEDDIKDIKKKLQSVITSRHADLNDVFGDSLSTIANELLSSNIITSDVNKTPTSNTIIRNFNSGLKLLKDKPSIEEHCNKFLKALSNVGGPVTLAAQMIREEWVEAVRNELGIELQLDYY